MRLITSKTLRALSWLLGAGIGLGLITLSIVYLIVYSKESTPAESLNSGIEPSVVVSSQLPINTSVDSKIGVPPRMPHLDFPPGSVEDACGLNEFPPRVGYYDYEVYERSNWANTPFNTDGDWIALETEECRTALENHINTINPYLWGKTTYEYRQFRFVVLDEPLNFERIFADPTGDLHRVQEALSRPECLLKGDERNWDLKEICHADSIHNYALINRFCFGDGVDNRNRAYYREEDSPTPEQDRSMWKQALVGDWVRKKCEGLDRTLELTIDQYPEIYELVLSLQDPAAKVKKNNRELLIQLAARLGDGAAGLTRQFRKFSHGPTYYDEEGYKYGRFSWLLTSSEWRKFATKEQPSTDRFLRTFNMLVLTGGRRADSREEIEFDWEWVVRHLCEPPYYRPFFEPEPEEPPEHSSCKEIVHELRQSDLKHPPLLEVLDKFEQVALELEVYE